MSWFPRVHTIDEPVPGQSTEYNPHEQQRQPETFDQQPQYSYDEGTIQVTDAEMCELTGYFLLPHPCHCHLYYTWFQGVFAPSACEPGLLFDKRSLTCLPPMMAACADGFGS